MNSVYIYITEILMRVGGWPNCCLMCYILQQLNEWHSLRMTLLFSNPRTECLNNFLDFSWPALKLAPFQWQILSPFVSKEQHLNRSWIGIIARGKFKVFKCFQCPCQINLQLHSDFGLFGPNSFKNCTLENCSEYSRVLM